MAQQLSKWSRRHNRSAYSQVRKQVQRCTRGTITGPKTLSCGTPDTTLTSLLRYEYTITCCDWFNRNSVNIPWVAARAVRWSGSAVSLVICSPARIAVCNTWSSLGTALCRVGGATSQLDLPSLTPLSVAGCGWLQLGAPHWATSENYCK